MSAQAKPFFITGGAVPGDSKSYVERSADRELLEALLAGDYCYVLNSRQMGKSSLVVRTVNHLREQGIAVAMVDLQKIGQNITVAPWYDGIMSQIGSQLDLPSLEDDWLKGERLSYLQQWLNALGTQLLEKVSGRVVIFVDEIDSVRSLPFSVDEFFAGIRQCHEERVADPALARLTFCLVGTALPSHLIRDVKSTPFNIARRISVADFTLQEALPLAAGLAGGEALVSRVMDWTGGHPYLTQRLCKEIADSNAKSPADVEKICAELYLSRKAERTRPTSQTSPAES